MIYRFTLISDEVDHFLREIQIDSDATFYDFHKIILSSVNYPDDQMTSFFICEEGWEKNEEVTLEDMGSRSEEDNWVMRSTKLSDLVEDEKQHLLFVFDPLADRPFFIELSEIITGKKLKEPICSRKIGDAPKQLVDFDDELSKTATSEDMGEDFYGDHFDMDDIDPEGFDTGGGENEIADTSYNDF